MERVTAVVCAAFDPVTDAAVESLRSGVRDARIGPVREPRHRPHFTLAAATVSRDEVAGVNAVAARVAATHAVIPIRLGTVGAFRRAGVIWLGPCLNPDLQALQSDVHRALIAAGWPSAFGTRTEPGSWEPHCTLVTRVDRTRLRFVRAAVEAQFNPITGTLDGLATILVGGRGDVGYARLAE